VRGVRREAWGVRRCDVYRLSGNGARQEMKLERSDRYFEYVGNLHIHSRYSDGAGSVAGIAHSAKRAGLDFIILNDHAHMTDALHLEDEGVYGGVRVLVGLEIGRRYHHYLAFGLSEVVTGNGLTSQEMIDQVNRKGGFGFLAHPFEKGMPFREKSIAYTWNDLFVTGYTGICIWNFSSRWKERVKGPLHGLFFLLFKAWTLKGPSRKTLWFWDQQGQRRRMVGIGGSDAHGAVFSWRGIRFVPLTYDYALNAITVHLLLKAPLSKEFTEAKAQILDALREGHLFIAHEHLNPAIGFRFHFEDDTGPRLAMGEEGPFRPGSLTITAPARGIVRLIRDGVLLKVWTGTGGVFRVDRKGVYRVEIYRRVPVFGSRPWIFANPIYLR
jgi:hypothetical protein